MLPFFKLAEVSKKMAATRSRKEKTRLLVELLRSLAPEEVESAVGFLIAEPRFGPVGLGPANLWALTSTPAASHAEKTVTEVETALVDLRERTPAETAERAKVLFSALTEEEREFLMGSLTNSLRQGSLAGIMILALAEASGKEESDVRRAATVLGSTAAAANALIGENRERPLPRSITLFQPIDPMLASTAASIDEALGEMKSARLEWKVDGVRAQVHKSGERVEAYSRQGNAITRGLGPLVAALRALPADSLVLDAELVLLDDQSRATSFQDTFSAIASGAMIPMGHELRLFAFDCLLRDGVDLIDEPLAARIEALRAIVPAPWLMPALDATSADADARTAFWESALEYGHEGLMVKDLAAPYVAGSRSPAWFKVKDAVTVDLVVLAAEWGSGRRRGFLSNLHLGARRSDGTFAMVGKTFKGLTDAMLREQTERFLALEVEKTEHVVVVRPEFVVEVTFNDVQRSPRYADGIALRFARVKRFRPDKSADQIEPLDALLAKAPPGARRASPRAEKRGRTGPDPRQLSLFERPEPTRK